MFCVRAFARRSLQLSLQSLRSSRSSRLNSTRNSTRAATKKWLVPVSIIRSYGGGTLPRLPIGAAPDTPARRVIRIIRIIRSYGGGCALCRACLASEPRPDTPARRVIRIIRIIRSYGHTAAWHCATLPRLPGIEASPAAPPDRVFFYHSHAHPSILAWAQDCPFNPGVGTGLPEKPITGSSPKAVLAASLTVCFFHHSHAQPSILAWAQDCHTQSWRGHRIAPLNPGVGTGLFRCFPENAGSAVLYSTVPLAPCTGIFLGPSKSAKPWL